VEAFHWMGPLGHARRSSAADTQQITTTAHHKKQRTQDCVGLPVTLKNVMFPEKIGVAGGDVTSPGAPSVKLP
jgi:hypothetical protein